MTQAQNGDETATAQDVQKLIAVATLEEAAEILNLGDTYDISTFLASFEKQINVAIETRKTRMLKPLTEAKNVVLRHEIEKMIGDTGRFDLTDSIPFGESCVACKGTGELYKFFRSAAEVPCKHCAVENDDPGYLFIPCRTCKGSGRYKKPGIDVECTRCTRDEEGKPSGKERVKCRFCHGKGVFRKLVLDAKIKSTTHCRHCKGRGFLLPEPPPKKGGANKRSATPANPVISQDLGNALKTAPVKE